MATLIFDIETVGRSWDSLGLNTKKSLTRWLEKANLSDKEKDFRLMEIKESLGLSPLTGYVVAIGIYDVERKQGAVYYIADAENREDIVSGEYILKQRTEKEMLEDFWEGAKSYDTFVSFCGRSFDVPFLLHRSVAHEVLPTMDLMQHRYLNRQGIPYHVDLQDELTFYGALNRKPSFDLFCQLYGIESAKSEVSGEDVAELFRTKKFRDIAHYNAKDVTAITELYERWFTYLAPTSFKNRLYT